MTTTATGVEVRFLGTAPGSELHEAWADLREVPRKGDLITAWSGTDEVYARVIEVSWPAWQFDHDPGVQAPTVQIDREGMDDQEWADFFDAIREKRSP